MKERSSSGGVMAVEGINPFGEDLFWRQHSERGRSGLLTQSLQRLGDGLFTETFLPFRCSFAFLLRLAACCNVSAGADLRSRKLRENIVPPISEIHIPVHDVPVVLLPRWKFDLLRRCDVKIDTTPANRRAMF